MEDKLEVFFKKFKKNNYKCFNVFGFPEFYFCDIFDFPESQEGFRVDPITEEKNDDWFGDEYYVIGFTSSLGDPIIVNVNDNNYPIYFCFHDDLKSFGKIEDSFDKFIENLQLLEEKMNEGISRQELIEITSKLDATNKFDFYKVLCYEYLED